MLFRTFLIVDKLISFRFLLLRTREDCFKKNFKEFFDERNRLFNEQLEFSSTYFRRKFLFRLFHFRIRIIFS